MSEKKKKNKLRFGLPKGSLQEATIEKMGKAGFNIQVSSRSYVPYVDDEELEIRLIRAQDAQTGTRGSGDGAGFSRAPPPAILRQRG